MLSDDCVLKQPESYQTQGPGSNFLGGVQEIPVILGDFSDALGLNHFLDPKSESSCAS